MQIHTYIFTLNKFIIPKEIKIRYYLKKLSLQSQSVLNVKNMDTTRGAREDMWKVWPKRPRLHGRRVSQQNQMLKLPRELFCLFNNLQCIQKREGNCEGEILKKYISRSKVWFVRSE